MHVLVPDVHIHLHVYMYMYLMHASVIILLDLGSRFLWGGGLGVEVQHRCAGRVQGQLCGWLCVEVDLVWPNAERHEDVCSQRESCLDLPLPQAAGARHWWPGQCEGATPKAVSAHAASYTYMYTYMYVSCQWLHVKLHFALKNTLVHVHVHVCTCTSVHRRKCICTIVCNIYFIMYIQGRTKQNIRTCRESYLRGRLSNVCNSMYM